YLMRYMPQEYPVKKDSIVVGIDASGIIRTERHPQFLRTPLQLKEYTVKLGDFVRKGDVIAKLSEEDLETKLKAATDKLKNDRFTAEKLRTEQQNYQLEMDQKVRELRALGESAYQDKAGLLLSKQSAAEQSIANKTVLMDQLNTTRTAYQSEKDTCPAKILALETAIASLQAENTTVQQTIAALTADTSADHTAEISALTQKKIANELSITDKTREKSRLETTDYTALLADAATKIAQLETEITALQTELSSTMESLKLVEEQRAKDRAKEEESIALLTKQAQAQHAVYDNQLRTAQLTAADSQKAQGELLAFSNDPQIRAEIDGVILKLGFTPNATIDTVAPVAEIGEEHNKVVLVQVDPMDIADVTIGQEVSFYVDAYPDATFYGAVKSKAYLQNDAGKFEVTVSFSPSEQPLLEGMGANATLIVKQKLDVITLSNKAISFKDGKSMVYLAGENSELQQTEIVTGFSNGRVTEIISGLAPGDTVWVEEQYEDS
ncbi:MAG: HlyD family efflux transporter periplasmic adaptor subunit, partial [Pygmaiobacter sp.]